MAIKTIQTPAGPMVIEIADDLLVECLVNGIPAYYDDSITCLFTQLPFALENIGFGYICMVLVLPIIIISLFGGIKENYRWFILNQAIWDLLVVYNFICNKPTLESLFWYYSTEKWNQDPPSCFYSFPDSSSYVFNLISAFFQQVVQSASYAPLFLLTLSRVLGLYFHHFYERHFSNKETFRNDKQILCRNIFKLNLVIIIFTFLIIVIVTLANWTSDIFGKNISEIMNDCYELYENETDLDTYNELSQQCNAASDIYYLIMRYLSVAQVVIPGILLAFSIIFTLLLIFKIGIQLKYQFKNNRLHFISTLRITIVIAFQCVTISFLFFCSVFSLYWFTFNNSNFSSENIPSWLSTIANDPINYKCFMVIRIFLDSLMVFIVLTEYRNVLVKPLKKLLVYFLHPNFALNAVKRKFWKTSKVVIIDNNHHHRRGNGNGNVSFVKSSSAVSFHR